MSCMSTKGELVFRGMYARSQTMSAYFKLRDYHALLTKSVSSLECNKQSLLIVLRQEISLQSLLDPSIAAVSMSRVFHFRNSTISR